MLLQSTLSPHLPVTSSLSQLLGRPITCPTTTIMGRLVLMFAVVMMEYVHARPPPLPPLAKKDGCYQVRKELDQYRMEGDAIILSFPDFSRALEKRKIVLPPEKYVIAKDNGTVGVANQSEGRIWQESTQLWFLPAWASDSGEYTCTYRNETFCVTGRIRLHVYTSSNRNVVNLSSPVEVTVGERLSYACPFLDDFNTTDRVIEWFKNSGPPDPQQGRPGSFRQDKGRLVIPAIKQSHDGFYTCRLTVLIKNQLYKVSRAVHLRVKGPDPAITPTVPDLSVTSNPVLSNRTVQAPIQPPVIVSPLNGTIFESLHGSGLELFCRVLTGCHVADSTLVTWLVNGQSVESSYLDRRALQGGRRVTRVSEGCQIELRLIFEALTDEDVKTELRCVSENPGGRQEVFAYLQLEDSTSTWLVVAAVAVSCFLTVVSIFLYVLFKPKKTKKMDYFLARQHSTF